VTPAVVLVLRLLPESDKIAETGIRLALTVAGALLLWQATRLLVGRLQAWMARGATADRPAAEQRARTVAGSLRSVLATVVWAGAFVHALDILGWDVKPLLAGAGILGVALGFGAQTLVRDLIAGWFILVEDQFDVGDLVEIDGKAAVVEKVTLRSTRLRNFNGHVHFVPNGEFRTVVNRSREWNRFVVDVPVSANEDLARALDVCRRVVDVLNAEPAWRARLIEPAQVWGVDSLAGLEAQLRIVLIARPGGDGFEFSRELRLRCHQALVAEKIRTGASRELALTPIPTGPAPEGAPSHPEEIL
jgi:moderate conductance mechanosensitive channel